MAEEVSFSDFINESRKKKERQDIAQKTLGSKANTPGNSSNTRDNAKKPSLASRMSSNNGVRKPRSSSAKPAANIEGKWQHDLHKLNNPQGPPKKLNRAASASQIDRNTRTYAKFQSTLQSNVPDEPGFNIRGAAHGGPVLVIASNFAPGTTAADVEAVMMPLVQEGGGELLECRVLSAKPTVMIELKCSEKGGADNVVATFNNKKADGRLLYVYIKEETPAQSRPFSNTGNAPSGQLNRSDRSDRLDRPARLTQSYDDMDMDVDVGAGAGAGTRGGSFQDGRYGFNDRRSPPRGPRRRY